MKKVVSIFIVCIICILITTPAFADDYRFSTGDDITFGRATSTNEPVAHNPMTENIRRNKDAALMPPPFGVFSGTIPTEQASLLHNNIRTAGSAFLPGGDLVNPHVNDSGLLPTTSVFAGAVTNTAPLFYADGSIGTLHIERFGRTISVFHGETLDNMNRGAGNFTSTSAWDGNVAMAAHNRGSAGFFSFVKDLRIGDRVTYTTLHGSRTYEVFYKEQINEFDHSVLRWSAENVLTLITCVENAPSLRWAAQLREVR